MSAADNGAAWSLSDLVAIRSRASGAVGLCHGCFDVFHIGHLRHLAAARQRCDLLFVTVTANSHVGKGPDRPVFDERLRAEVVAAIRHVDGVAISHAATAVGVLETMRPDIFFKGSDYRSGPSANGPNFLEEQETARTLGIELAFTDELTSSSSLILERHPMVHPGFAPG